MNETEMAAGGGGFIGIIYLAVIILMVVGMWKVFSKAGQPGWAAIVPIYNLIVLLQIAGKPIWWIILCLIPFVGIVIVILVDISLAKNFGKGGGFAAGLILLPFVFFPILGFGSAEYQGGGGAPAAPAPAPPPPAEE